MSGYTFVCLLIGMYRCKRPACRCEENWNAEREAEMAERENEVRRVAQAIAVAHMQTTDVKMIYDAMARAAIAAVRNHN